MSDENKPCGATFAGTSPGPHFYSWTKPCVLPAGHDVEYHRDADGTTWTGTIVDHDYKEPK